MIRFTLAICTWWIGMTGVAAAQPPAGVSAAPQARTPVVKSAEPEVTTPVAKSFEPEATTPVVKSVAAPAKSTVEILPPLPPAVSPGEAPSTRESRAHEQYLLQLQAQAESVHRAAFARAAERTRRLEAQRWFGISNTRPTASPDPYNGDYSPGWASNYTYFPYRWVGSGEPWGFVEGQ
jgi:hypothetical protein